MTSGTCIARASAYNAGMFLASLSQAQKEAFICLAHNVVVSDGDFVSDERRMMADMRASMALGDEVEAHYLPLDGIERIFDTRRTRVIAVIGLIRLSYADGSFEIEERCFLEDVCSAFDISDADFVQMQHWARRYVTLEREYRAFLD